MMREAEERAKAKGAEVEAAFAKETVASVRSALVKTVKLSPDAVDEALIKKAVVAVKHAP